MTSDNGCNIYKKVLNTKNNIGWLQLGLIVNQQKLPSISQKEYTSNA